MKTLEGLKYNYVILSSNWDLYKQSYYDVFDKTNVRYITDSVIRNLIDTNPLYHVHFSKINSTINLPFKSIWNSLYFKNDFDDEKPICFILFEGWAKLNHSINLTSYLRKKYKDCKIVFFLQDLFIKQKKDFSNVPLDAEEEKRIYDLIVSFDQNESTIYGFEYHPLVFSDYQGEIKDMPTSDIYFLGQAKNRLNEILETFEILSEYNLIIDMYIVGVKPEDQIYKDKIKYIKAMSYQDNLQHVIHTKCLLEIMQKNGFGFTQRVVEAVVLNKKLLTNNPTVNDAPFFRKDYISQFSSPSSIDREFVKQIRSSSKINYSYKEELSPINFLRFVDKKIR